MQKNLLIPFVKMQTLGNDFIIIDLRENETILTSAIRSKIANRRFGIGADQVITLHPPTDPKANISIQVSNANGSINNVYGNNIRCVAEFLFKQNQLKSIHIQTQTGTYKTTILEKEIVLKFETPSLKWDEIPLTQEVDTLYAPIELGPLKTPSIARLLKPHMIFFPSQLEHIPLDYLGSHLERHHLLTKRANIVLAQKIDEKILRVRVWEKDIGISPGCACATAAAVFCGIKRQFLSQNEQIECLLDGGNLGVFVDEHEISVKSTVSTTFTVIIDLADWE